MPYIDGMYYTQRMYEHVQAVIAVTGAPPASHASLDASQLPPPMDAPTPQQAELISRTEAIEVTEHVYTPPEPTYTILPTTDVQRAVEMASLAAEAAAQVTDTAAFSSTTITTTEQQKYLLQIGYIGNPPDWLSSKIAQVVGPIAQRVGWTLEFVGVNPATIDIRFAAPSNPIPMILIYAILAVIAAAIAGAVIISIVWTNLATKEQDTQHINDLAEIIAGIAADPNIDPETKRQMLLDLNKSIGGVASADEGPTGLAGLKDLMLLAIGGSILMSVMKK